MSVSSYFSPITKILTQSGYANSQQIEQALTQFQQSGKKLTDEGSSFIEIIESITGHNIPKHIRQNLLLCLNFPSEEYQEADDVKENRVIYEILSELPDEIELILSGTENSHIISLTNKILAKALLDGISDIHIEPLQEALRIRFRKDGVLYQAFDLLPKKIISAIASRFKILADLDITERRISQTGKFQRNFQGCPVYFQVSTLPSRYGEKIVLRIFYERQTQLNLDDLITNQETLSTVKKLAKSSSGLIVVIGSNANRLTTLYSILAEQNNPGVNIVTAEDSIKYALPGITQVYVMPEKGKNFCLSFALVYTTRSRYHSCR
jgi:type IV pilus assembly protein PilB